MDWNYRIGTWLFKNHYYGMPDEPSHIRKFAIVKCLYIDKDEPPFNFAKINLYDEESIDNLKFHVDSIKEALDIGVIYDLDNFPHIYEEE